MNVLKSVSLCLSDRLPLSPSLRVARIISSIGHDVTKVISWFGKYGWIENRVLYLWDWDVDSSQLLRIATMGTAVALLQLLQK
jgi:hypothetical protein